MKKPRNQYPPDLYGGEAPHNGSDTSRIAASMAKTESVRAEVLDAIRATGWNGTTADALREIIDRPMSSLTARVRELVLLGEVRDSKVRRMTRHNRPARVYVATNLVMQGRRL